MEETLNDRMGINQSGGPKQKPPVAESCSIGVKDYCRVTHGLARVCLNPPKTKTKKKKNLGGPSSPVELAQL